jgi:hypothetical protein
MGKSRDRHRSWLPEANSAFCVRTGPLSSWIYQGTSLRSRLPESAAIDVQPSGNSDEEFLDEAESAGIRGSGPWRSRTVGPGSDEQGFLSMNWPQAFLGAVIGLLLALNPNPTNKPIPRDCVTLYEAMCRYRGTGEGSGSIIRALLSGKLRVLGNVDGTVRGLILSQAEVRQLGKNDRARHNRNARTRAEVAEEVDIATPTVFLG